MSSIPPCLLLSDQNLSHNIRLAMKLTMHYALLMINKSLVHNLHNEYGTQSEEIYKEGKHRATSFLQHSFSFISQQQYSKIQTESTNNHILDSPNIHHLQKCLSKTTPAPPPLSPPIPPGKISTRSSTSTSPPWVRRAIAAKTSAASTTPSSVRPKWASRNASSCASSCRRVGAMSALTHPKIRTVLRRPG